ncbi:hypothetical protein [Streptomyces sp. NPDC001315]|uniref:hypothetical protein n=1 Tax=Streptomyces sp. NPDC001315 TaxID=3364562 RepID=UPI0036B71676
MYAISLGDDGAELRPLEPWHAEEFLAHLDRGRDFIGQFIAFGSKETDVASARAMLGVRHDLEVWSVLAPEWREARARTGHNDH